MKRYTNYILVRLCVLAFCASLSGRAATIWNGPTTNFVNNAGSDPNLPANQDRLTEGVWITRGSVQGIYNAATESSFTHTFSPQDTTWADGTLENLSLIQSDAADERSSVDLGGR